VLTPFANAHVDQCCLRFLRIYIPSCLGKYTFGRMNFDADYVEKTLFFLEDSANQGVFNEMEAEQKYKDAFPTTFPEGLRQLMDQAGITVEKMAEKLNMEERTFQRWMAKEDKRFTEDFVIMVSLILELPDWIGDLLLDRAGIALSNKNPRHLALQWIRRAMWKDGIQKANEYLKERNFKPLSI
jgi:transcriptional regulator with XRE-family HTH domain